MSFNEALHALRVTIFTGMDKSAILLRRAVLLNIEPYLDISFLAQ